MTGSNSTTAGFEAVRSTSTEGRGEALNYGKMMQDLRLSFGAGVTKDLEWRRGQLKQLRKLVEENHEELSKAVLADHGGYKLRGLIEFMGAVKEADFALSNLKRWTSPTPVSHDDGVPLNLLSRSEIRNEPKGVVLIIAPWNYPILLTLIPMVSAIAAGNCICVKPSEVSVNSTKLMDELFPKYFDSAAIRMVTGAVPETTALLAEKWNHIFYTGNGAVGRIVMTAAAKHLTPVTLELGGKSPVYVDKSCNLNVAVERISFAKWSNAGQTCIAPDYIMVHKDIEEKFLKLMQEKLQAAYEGDPKKSQDYGKIINGRHVSRVARLAKETKGTVVTGGSGSADANANFLAPTIIHNAAESDPIMQEEIFGPVLPVRAVGGPDEAIATINRVCDRPLALYIFAEDDKVVQKILDSTLSGGVCVNSAVEHILGTTLPFGGVGESGIGAYHGKFGFDEFSHKRSVMYKDTKILTQGLPFHHAPEGLYDMAVKFLIIGLSPVQKLMAGGTVVAVAVAAAAALFSRYA